MILATNVYDPEEEEGRRRPSHVTGKEVRVFAIVAIVAIVLLVPVYDRLMDLRNSHVCVQNLHAIGTAVSLYATDNNDRLPPLYAATASGEPIVYRANHVFSWVSLLGRYMEARASFEDPAARPEEGVTNETGEKEGPILSDYGMFGALSAQPLSNIPSPATEGLIADSSSNGALGTYDPAPFKDSNGKPIPDGIVLGFDTSNFTPFDSVGTAFQKARFVTRLAFPDSGKSGFSKTGRTRHPDGTHVLMADFHLRTNVTPLEAQVEHMGKTSATTGLWTVP